VGRALVITTLPAELIREAHSLGLSGSGMKLTTHLLLYRGHGKISHVYILPHFPEVVILLSPAHFHVFPSSHSAILFARMVAMIMFVSEKLFGMADTVHYWFEGNI
jgi:hypothetical protein